MPLNPFETLHVPFLWQVLDDYTILPFRQPAGKSPLTRNPE